MTCYIILNYPQYLGIEVISGNFNACPCFNFRFIYETEQFNGVGELLEILGRWVQRQMIEFQMMVQVKVILE